MFDALSDLNGTKHRALMAFSMAFWQFNWDFVKEKVLGFFRDF